MSYSHLVTRSGTAKKSSFQDRLAFMFMKVRCTGLPSPNPRKIRDLTIEFPSLGYLSSTTLRREKSGFVAYPTFSFYALRASTKISFSF